MAEADPYPGATQSLKPHLQVLTALSTSIIQEGRCQILNLVTSQSMASLLSRSHFST